MKRRAALRDLLLIAGGVTFLPACLNNPGKASIALKNIDISADDEKLLAEIASAIIPQTDTPGAREVGSHLFVLKMLDDCYEKKDQQTFVKGLHELEENTKAQFGHSFTACTTAQKEEILEAIEARKGDSSSVAEFYKTMKERTIQGYLTSKYVVLEVEKYTIIPAVAYNGYAPLKT
jgi:hypothetical protein